MIRVVLKKQDLIIMNRKTETSKSHKTLFDVVQVEDYRTVLGESYYCRLLPLRNFRGNYGVPRLYGDVVVKGFFEADESTIERLSVLHKAYTDELRKYIPFEEVREVKEGRKYHLEQNLIKGDTFEAFLKQANEKETIEAYQQLLDYALNFVCSSDKIVGIDQKPENWIKEEKRGWVFIDTFPPFYTSSEISFGEVFYLRDFEKDFSDRPDYSFFRNPKKVARRFWLKSSKFSDIDFKDASLEVLKKYDDDAVNYWERYEEGYK